MRSSDIFIDVNLIKRSRTLGRIIDMSDRIKSNEYAMKHDPDYVCHVSKGGATGYIKRDKGPAKHHVPYGRHKVDEKVLDQGLVEDVLKEIKGNLENFSNNSSSDHQ